MTERLIQPRAWVTSEPDGNPHDGSYGGMVEDVILCIDRPDFGIEPLYDQSAIDAAVAKEREECAKAVEIFDRTFQTGGGIASAIRARGNDA